MADKLLFSAVTEFVQTAGVPEKKCTCRNLPEYREVDINLKEVNLKPMHIMRK